jgi:hypothetical protein
LRGDTLVVTSAAAALTYQGVLTAGRDSVVGTLVQGPGSFPLAFGRGAVARNRPQTPARPFPYREEEVTVDGAGGVRLGCTLATPAGPGPAPAVAFLSGSGAQDRDETVLEHRPFLVISDRLVRAGVATLRCDDRGVGAVHRLAGPRPTVADLAADAAALVRVLRARPGVAPDRVGLLGHSEGGLVAPSRGRLAERGVPRPARRARHGRWRRARGADRGTGAGRGRAAGRRGRAWAPSAPDRGRRLGGRDSADAARRFTAVADSAAAEAGPGEGDALRRSLLAQRAAGASAAFRDRLAADQCLRSAACVRRCSPSPARATCRCRPRTTWRGSRPRCGPPATATTPRRLLDGLNHLFQTARTGLPDEYGELTETVAPAALER